MKGKRLIETHITPESKEITSIPKIKEKNYEIISTKESFKNETIISQNLNFRIKVDATDLSYVVINDSNEFQE